MTNQALPQYPPLPPRYWSTNRKGLSVAQVRKAQEKGRKRAVADLNEMIDVEYRTLVRRNPDKDKRALSYLHKPVPLWAEQQMKAPEDFAEDWADWELCAPEDGAVRDAVLEAVEALVAEMQARQAGQAPGSVVPA